MRSLIVTGASACGKTTLIREAMSRGYNYLPTHMTRSRRINEIDGVDAIFIDEAKFILNYLNKKYLEPSLEYAYTINSYYGTPINWIEKLRLNDYCATPVSALLARKIVDTIPNLLWIYLTCDYEVRLERLLLRGLSHQEIIKRIKTIENQQELHENTITFDTSKNTASQIIQKIMEL